MIDHSENDSFRMTENHLHSAESINCSLERGSERNALLPKTTLVHNSDSNMLSQSFQKSTVGGSSGSGGFSCSGETGSTVGPAGSTISSAMDSQTRNPLLCFVCDNYYTEPSLLVCYHTFCAKCLHGREADRKITCPLCGVQTALKDGQAVPAPDMLMRHLIELANAENPPCANCDKRDKNNMYFCVTCGQALCTNCRENTHRAKMFSAHEVVHMSKCSKEAYRKQCTQHGEQHVMFSNSQRTMLCENCFQDVPPESKVHCVDIDTAYNQGCKKLERAIHTVQSMQSSVRDGLLVFKNLLDELRRNMESEKVTINSFCEGMRQAIAKTHSSMMLEVQRQFESKERLFHGQLTNLGSMLPLLQLHLLLAQTFSLSANKYQFLDLAYPMVDRLNAVSQLSLPLRPIQSSQIHTNFRAEFARTLEPWVGSVPQIYEGGRPKSGSSIYESRKQQQQQQQQQHVQYLQQQQIPHQPQPAFPLPQPTPSRRLQGPLLIKNVDGESGPFSNHCRNFDSQLKDLSAQLGGLKKKIGDLTQDVTLLRRAHTPPLTMRYETVTRDCNALEQALECRQIELERIQSVFHTLWEQQICRVQTEREIFQAQIGDVMTLASEVKNLSNAARQLEPYVVALSAADIAISQMHQQSQSTNSQQGIHPKPSAEEAAHLQSVLEHMSLLHQAERLRKDTDAAKGECRVHSTTSPGHASTSSSAQDKLLYIKLDGKGKSSRVKPSRDRSETRESRETQEQQQQQQTLIAQAMLESGYGMTGGRESKRGSVLSQIIGKVRTKEERKKSPEEPSRAKTPTRDRGKAETRAEGSQSKSDRQQEGKPKGKGKVASLYHSLSGKVMGSSHSIPTTVAIEDEQLRRHLPPPPPPTRRPTTQITSIHREDSSPIEIPPDGTVKRRGRLSRPASAGEKDDGDYPAPRKAKSVGSPTDFGDHLVRAVIHKESRGSQPVSPRRHRSTDSALRQVRMYPASDTEDSVFKQSSCESLALSDIGLSGDHRKTLIVVVGSKSKRLMQKQRSWETFPPKRRDGHNKGRFCHDPEVLRSGFQNGSPLGSTMSHIGPTLKKADSFEGHEEAVRTLVAAVQQHQQSQHQHQQSQQSQSMQQQHHQRKHSGPKAAPPGTGSG